MKSEKKQPLPESLKEVWLFDEVKDMGFDPREEWEGMPEYDNKQLPPPAITAKFKFSDQESFEEFNDLIKKHVYKTKKVFDGMQSKTEKQAWFPLREKGSSYEYR